MIVIGGSNSKELAEKVSNNLDCKFVTPEKKEFPDGEIYLRIPEEIQGEEAIVIQSTYYPPNRNLMELFLLLDACEDLGAEKITAVIPYLAYARQDKRFESGEAVSLRTVAKLIEESGADEVSVIDIHPQDIGEDPEVFDVPSHNLTAASILVEHIEDNFELKDPIVLGPDAGAKKRAEWAAEAIEADWDYMEKKRLGPEEVEMTPHEMDVENRDAVILDDIISTGGTMVEAIEILNERGARNVYAACTHPVLIGDALKNIREAGVEEVIATDTIKSEVSKVSVAPVVSKALR